MADAEERPILGAVTVRPAIPRDAGAFVEVYRAVAAERRWIQTEVVPLGERAYRRRFRRSWTTEEATLVALADGALIGSLSISREDRPATRHVATLGMFVAGSWRRRGVGTALMAEALRWARLHGIEKIELSVYPHNEAAIALYRKFGFDVEGRLVRHAKKSYGYEDEILMAVWLDDVDDEEPA
jgi:RimJ/RimL family protein N-acetyltransferase